MLSLASWLTSLWIIDRLIPLLVVMGDYSERYRSELDFGLRFKLSVVAVEFHSVSLDCWWRCIGAKHEVASSLVAVLKVVTCQNVHHIARVADGDGAEIAN